MLILFLVVAALGAFIWFVERDLPGTDERAELEKRLLSFESNEITELIIERDGVRVHLTRPAEGEQGEAIDDEDSAPMKRQWRLLEPYDTRADVAKADRLADTLSLLEKERALEDVEPAAVGLDAPRAVVTVRSADGEATLRIGTEIPASTNMIVGRGAETFAVADSVWTQLEIEPGDWRSRDLFPLHRNAVERVDIQTGAGATTLVRRDDVFWMESPVVDLAESDSVDTLLDAMFRVQVGEFLEQPEGDLEAMGLASPSERIEVAFTGIDQPVALELGLPSATDADSRYARIDGQLVTIGTDLDEAVGRAPNEWQASAWTSLEVYQIDSFRAVDADGELLLERSGADWARDGVRISYQPVSDFLYALTGAAGERVIAREAAAALGANLEAAVLELTLAGEAEEEVLSLYEAGESTIAGREGRDFLLALSEGTVEDLRVKLQAIRDQPELGDEPGEDDEG